MLDETYLDPRTANPDLPDVERFDRSFLPTIEQACRDYAVDECLVFGSESLSYADVGALSSRIANALIRAGFEPGMKGAVYSLNSAVAFVAALGLLRAGGVWIPVNPRNSPRDNVEVLSTFGCDAIFYQEAFAPAVAEVVGRLEPLRASVRLGDASSVAASSQEPSDHSSLDEFVEGVSPNAAPVDREGHHTLTIPMTGGTTGLPKGVMLSHRNFCAIEYAMRTSYDGRRPVVLCAAPMTHVGGRITLTSLSSGGRFVILDKVDPQVILETVERERITDFFLPPTAIYSLIDQPNLGDFDLESLVTVSYGSAPMSIPKLKQAIRSLGPVMRGGFGQTECPMFISRLTQEEHFEDGELGGGLVSDQRLRSVGRATILSKLAIMDDCGEILPAGERGEIVVRGPMVSEGYYESPSETAKIRKNGWHLTGDVGYLDEDGYLFIVDRKKDMIITGGFNVYSTEVEQALMALPEVKVACVFGTPSEKWGEEVRAAVVLEDGARCESDELVARVRERLGGVKTPKALDIVRDLPRTAVGKIDKKALREPFWQGHSRRV